MKFRKSRSRRGPTGRGGGSVVSGVLLLAAKEPKNSARKAFSLQT